MPAGSFGTWPAGMKHFVWAKGETIIQLHGTGPWSLTYVNPEDDPPQVAEVTFPRLPSPRHLLTHAKLQRAVTVPLSPAGRGEMDCIARRAHTRLCNACPRKRAFSLQSAYLSSSVLDSQRRLGRNEPNALRVALALQSGTHNSGLPLVFPLACRGKRIAPPGAGTLGPRRACTRRGPGPVAVVEVPESIIAFEGTAHRPPTRSSGRTPPGEIFPSLPRPLREAGSPPARPQRRSNGEAAARASRRSAPCASPRQP
jgi:hypothetical protein